MRGPGREYRSRGDRPALITAIANATYARPLHHKLKIVLSYPSEYCNFSRSLAPVHREAGVKPKVQKWTFGVSSCACSKKTRIDRIALVTLRHRAAIADRGSDQVKSNRARVVRSNERDTLTG